eukprot:s4222_g9.t1
MGTEMNPERSAPQFLEAYVPPAPCWDSEPKGLEDKELEDLPGCVAFADRVKSAVKDELSELRNRAMKAEQERDEIKRKANEFISKKKAEFAAQLAERDQKIKELTAKLAQAKPQMFNISKDADDESEVLPEMPFAPPESEYGDDKGSCRYLIHPHHFLFSGRIRHERAWNKALGAFKSSWPRPSTWLRAIWRRSSTKRGWSLRSMTLWLGANSPANLCKCVPSCCAALLQGDDEENSPDQEERKRVSTTEQLKLPLLNGVLSIARRRPSPETELEIRCCCTSAGRERCSSTRCVNPNGGTPCWRSSAMCRREKLDLKTPQLVGEPGLSLGFALPLAYLSA